MKLFMIGGITTSVEASDSDQQLARLREIAAKLIGPLVSAGHQLLICSPFDGSFDAEVIRNLENARDTLPQGVRLFVYHPQEDSVVATLRSRLEVLPKQHVRTFGQSLAQAPDGTIDWQYSWLLAQLTALDQCDAVVAVGGKSTRSTNLLLHLAEARRFPLLTFGYLGGAAAISLARRHHQLSDRLGDEFGYLQDMNMASKAGMLIERLADGSVGRARSSVEPRFFISYPRERHTEADFVETVLRRRNHHVFRDEHSFRAGANLPNSIIENIHRADVFIALWCKEYACSPWCYDELDLALQRHQEGPLELWIFMVDGTRIVPPGARNLIAFPCLGRDGLEQQVLKQLDTFRRASIQG
jgi:hypothetical protein